MLLQDAVSEAAILASTMTNKHEVYNTGEGGSCML